MSALEWIGKTGWLANGVGKVLSIGVPFSDTLQQWSNTLKNAGEATEALTDKNLSAAEKAGQAVESGSDQFITNKAISFLKGFLPDWMARMVGTWVGNIGGDVVGNFVESITSSFSGEKTEPKSTAPSTVAPKVEPTPSAADVGAANGYKPGELDVDGDGVTDNLIDSSGQSVTPGTAGIPQTEQPQVGTGATA